MKRVFFIYFLFFLSYVLVWVRLSLRVELDIHLTEDVYV